MHTLADQDVIFSKVRLGNISRCCIASGFALYKFSRNQFDAHWRRNSVKSATIKGKNPRRQNGTNSQTQPGIWLQTFRGQPRTDDHLMLALFWRCLRDIPERFGPRSTVYQRFHDWRNRGAFDQMLKRLHIKLNEQG